jgi:carbon storage regulator
MLVLSRKPGESLFINDVEVFVVDVRGDRIRLGISAPKDVPVHRAEVYRAIKRRQKAEADQIAEQTNEQQKDEVA